MKYKVVGNPNIYHKNKYYNDGMEIELEPKHAEALIKDGLLVEVNESDSKIEHEYKLEPESVEIPVYYGNDLPPKFEVGQKPALNNFKKDKKRNK